MESEKYCESLPLAIATVPMQRFERLYTPDTALERGTMFDALYFPFEGDGGRCDDK